MQQNNNTNQDSSTLAQQTNTMQGTTEHGALKTIHKSYNKLNGYEAMLHIINRFKFVLYPFIFLSILGSTYSFYNDFIVAFPMLGDWNIVTSFFFSIMLEIVRDGALIALFNGKMNLPSRTLVIVIFLSVTTYMYSSHLKAIDVIEQKAIEYTLANQTTASQSVTNPKLKMTTENLARAKKRLKATEEERTTQLDISANAKYRVNKINAQKQIPLLDKKIEKLEATISKYQTELITQGEANIKSVKDTQKIISVILLATLLLVESLAMLGAVIKFINKDNADKEIAKHSEIVEEYVAISEQMKLDNEELTKNLSSVVKSQSQSNQRVMNMMNDDMQNTSTQNVAFLEMMAQNKRETQEQLNQVISVLSQMNMIQPLAQMATPQQVAQHQEPKPTRKIGFQTPSKKEMITALYADGTVTAGEKLAPKSLVVDVKKRVENQKLTDFYKELQEQNIVEFKRGMGYYAVADYQTAISCIKGVI
jgi:hypothetical protein